MKPTLVLLTANHPFTHNGGETMFVGPELPALARAFGHVVVVPLYDQGQQLALPLGCTLDRGLAQRWRRGHWRWALHALTWPGFWAEFGRGLRRGGWQGAARVWRWAAVAAATWDWIRCSRLPAPFLFYSYWRGGQTMAAARWAAGRANAGAVTRVHRYELYDDAFDPPFQPWVQVYEGLALVIAVARHGYDYLQRHGVRHVIVSHLGVAAATRLAAESNDGCWRIVSCASMTPVKRVDRCARVAVELARRHSQRRIEWTHFGDGPTRPAVETALVDAPENLCARLIGLAPNEAVLAHYRERPVDLFMLLSSSEGLPVSIQEALAHGIPVVACDVGGVPEAVDADGENGALLPPDVTIERAVEVIGRLLEAPAEQRASRRAAAHQRWVCAFDSERSHAALADRLAHLASSTV